jgi:predicted phosphodiesterase
MKIDIISDLHQDFYIKEKNKQSPKFLKQVIDFADLIINEEQEPGEVLVLAGDFGHYNQQTMFLLIELKKTYKDIIVVPGNHDRYLVSGAQISKYNSKSSERIEELKTICTELSVHYLDGNIIEINNVRFGGTGSWYNLPSEMDINSWKKVMNDSRYIYDGYSKQPYGMYQSYSQPSRNWDTQKFYLSEKAKLINVSNEKCDVFITHVALNEPSAEEGMFHEYINDHNNIFYYTDNMQLLKDSKCKVHIHGHTHQNLDYTKDGIRIICNPLGYPGETYNTIQQIEI